MKYSVPSTSMMSLGAEPDEPSHISSTLTVPAGVPSVLHNSES